MPEFVRIENIAYGTYLAVDRHSYGAVVLKEYNGNDEYQQWTEIEIRGGVAEDAEEGYDESRDDYRDFYNQDYPDYPVFLQDNYGDEYRDFYLAHFDPQTGYLRYDRRDPNGQMAPYIYQRLRNIRTDFRVFGPRANYRQQPGRRPRLSAEQLIRQPRINSRGKRYFYKNVKTEGFLTVDRNGPVHDQVITLSHNQTTWVVEPLNGNKTIRVTHDRNKYMKSDKALNRVQLHEITVNNKYLWKITSASED